MWVKDSNTWVLKDRKLYLSSDNSTVTTGITIGVESETGITFNPCVDNRCVAWYDFSNPLNLSVDNNFKVSKVSDKVNNYDLTQSNALYRPLYTTDGVKFDGIETYMTNRDIDKPQPTTYYIVARYMGSSDGMIFDAMDYVRNAFYVDDGNYSMYATGWGTTSIPVNNDLSIYVVIFNFESSTTTVGDTTAGVNLTSSQANLSGITIGTNYLDNDYFGNFYIKELLIRDGVDDESIQNDIKNYLSIKYNITT
jgi:hypothetical protein